MARQLHVQWGFLKIWSQKFDFFLEWHVHVFKIKKYSRDASVVKIKKNINETPRFISFAAFEYQRGTFKILLYSYVAQQLHWFGNMEW